MTENDFFLALLEIFEKAREAGWPDERIEDATHEALEEWKELDELPSANASEEGQADE